MSTAADTRSVASASSLISSTAFRTFVVVFAIAAPIIYMICEMRNWPLFTYHPATDRLDLFYAASRKDEGPAMHWYGWTANTLIGSAILGILAAMLPENVTRRIPLSLTWIVPLICVPVLIYALRFYWRWE
jgi:hypothetical protein